MQTFEDYTYERPNLDETKAAFKELVEQFKQADSAEEAMATTREINALSNHFSTMENIVYIRASINTKDAFYQKEEEFMDNAEPEMQELDTIYYQALIESPYRKDLEENLGEQLFNIADFSIRSFSPEVIGLLQEENRLATRYNKLIASAEMEFQGKTYTLAQLSPFTQDPERKTRKEAVTASTHFFEENASELDEIYDKLIKVRHEIATKLGFRNFIELGYLRMQRFDYNAEMVASFRKQIREKVVPLVSKLYEKQAARIGLDAVKFYDENFAFQTGNPVPKGNPEWIIENGKTMYEELSAETDEFFHFMLDRKLMDLEAKKGKEAGGYCTFIENYQSPFIFSNFNGTSDDIDVLTHEAGHAFQFYSSRHIEVPEYLIPTSDAAEIHSMSMEFFTWPWMEKFFQEDTEKYKYAHLAGGLQFLPYGAAVDEFQHLVYEHPEWTPAERKDAWRKLEETYLPHRDYDGMSYLEAGGFWQRQGHIYEVPFYYIDYTLAQFCAFQFWQRSRENRAEAWEDYLNLCKLGGTKSFLNLVAAANLKSPFEEQTMDDVVRSVEAYLDSVDDQTL
ncbi:M3 family oligoendopeptidase [Lentibacillus sediminis]|uniref:M3 family oligoendopeptidase n=1 Tax=Lentibacillus sediminis TaxID=1940529 RepID=UPI000C1C382C|nr:M3 family oligoendopeptidase [Lentibacillus sediminis]